MKGNVMFTLEKNSDAKAFVIYDNFFFAEKAKAILQGAMAQTGVPGCSNVKSWRLDALKLSFEANQALTDAADAHLIVFAGQRTQSLPFWLEDWLEKWVAFRQINDAALAVIGGRNGDALTMPQRPELSRFAKKHGLNFVVDEHISVEDEANFVGSGDFKDLSFLSRMGH
jgi:hypothetical protein